MWILRKLLASLAIAGLGGLLLASAAPPAWATGGGGGGGEGEGAGLQYRLEYLEEEEEEEATDEPEGFGFTYTPRFSFSYSKDSDFIYLEEEEETGTPFSYKLDVQYPVLDERLGLRLRFDYRFPTMEIEEEEQPASTLEVPKIKYKFQTWTGLDALEAVDEDPLRGLDSDKYVWDEEEGLGIRVGDFIIKVNMSPEALRTFQEWDRSDDAHDSVENFLGDDVYDKMLEQFGEQGTANGGGADQSPWAGIRIYCGATCVYSYE